MGSQNWVIVYSLDTNAILYYLKGESTAVVALEQALQQGLPLFVSTIVEAELFRFPLLTAREERDIIDFLSICSIVPLDSQVARSSGAISRTINIHLADSIVAATALFTGSVLLTRNVRDFKNVQGLVVEQL